MKYFVHYQYGDRIHGKYAGLASFATLLEAQAEVTEIHAEHPDAITVLIEGEEIERR